MMFFFTSPYGGTRPLSRYEIYDKTVEVFSLGLKRWNISLSHSQCRQDRALCSRLIRIIVEPLDKEALFGYALACHLPSNDIRFVPDVQGYMGNSLQILHSGMGIYKNSVFVIQK